MAERQYLWERRALVHVSSNGEHRHRNKTHPILPPQGGPQWPLSVTVPQGSTDRHDCGSWTSWVPTADEHIAGGMGPIPARGNLQGTLRPYVHQACVGRTTDDREGQLEV